jgi:hypothetical protein
MTMASNGEHESAVKRQRTDGQEDSPAVAAASVGGDELILSEDPDHPANLIPSLCAKFWTLGWVTGTGGGCSIRHEYVVSTLSPNRLQLLRIKLLMSFLPSP